MVDHCEICNSKSKLTVHHIIPQRLSMYINYRKCIYPNKYNHIKTLCRCCHDSIERIYMRYRLLIQTKYNGKDNSYESLYEVYPLFNKFNKSIFKFYNKIYHRAVKEVLHNISERDMIKIVMFRPGSRDQIVLGKIHKSEIKHYRTNYLKQYPNMVLRYFNCYNKEIYLK